MDVRIATAKEMKGVFELTHDEYVRQGYCQPRHDRVLQHYIHLDNIPETFVFVAVENNKVIGTNSLTIDGPNKLHVDCDFPNETQVIRQQCNAGDKILASSWRIVTCDALRNTMTTFLHLVDITINTIVSNDVDVCLFTFNPKHESFYSKLLGLHTITYGSCRATQAPSVLMQVTTDKLIDKWQKICKRRQIKT